MLGAVKFSPISSFFFIVTLARIDLVELPKLEIIANAKAQMLKFISLNDDSPTPTTTTDRAMYAHTLMNSRRKIIERTAVTTGSPDLITCVNDTAPKPMEMTAP
ncbi:acetyl-acetyltransferase, putative [Babesia caballi]|uniref:Acetyl-acetyltransferase, putative n=1 Tax=Babesia caballi TaxID=5871 RepID=A0AAV4LZ74_BABCB|nr:acetyl-acetyltransferase, putative [Babesia caballi]